MARQLSAGRKAAYYAGTGVVLLGYALFISVFVTLFMRVREITDYVNHACTHFFDSRARVIPEFGSEMLRGFLGAALVVAGNALRSVGARGLAGSGIVLDPEKARCELEPYSRMAGGMVGDAMDEVGVKPGGPPERIVMLKCPGCGTLNDETSKFCRECGGKL